MSGSMQAALGKRERIENRQPHIRHRDLGQDRTVGRTPPANALSDCGCTVTRTLSGGTSNSRQASMIFSPLFSIVAAESMVIRRPITHVGCFKARSGVMPAKSANGVFPEGSAGSREPDRFHLGMCTHSHALVHGVVLAVDGQNWNIPLARRRCQNLSGRDHAFLVGQSDGLAGEDCRMRSLKPRDPDNRRDDEVSFGIRGAGYRPVLPTRLQFRSLPPSSAGNSTGLPDLP